MALMYSEQIPFGQKAHDFSLLGIDGLTYSLKSFEGSAALVVVFMCNHCPYVQAAWDRLVALQTKYRDSGVRFVGINSNDSKNYTEDSYEKMKSYAAEKKHNFPYLVDDTQEVANAYGATCTPDIFVYDANFELAYHGRIDDNWQEVDKVTKNDLDQAISAVITATPVEKDQKPSMGCSIKWKR